MKKLILLFLMAVTAVSVCGCQMTKIKSETPKKETFNYEEKSKEALTEMISNAAESEKLGNYIKAIWGNSIWQRRDEMTDAYTLDANGNFNEDFNTSLSNFFASDTYSSQVEKINKSSQKIVSLMKELNDPPKEYKERYDDLKRLYLKCSEFSSFVISCSGSYNSFCEKFETLDSESVQIYDEIKINF